MELHADEWAAEKAEVDGVMNQCRQLQSAANREDADATVAAMSVLYSRVGTSHNFFIWKGRPGTFWSWLKSRFQ